MTDETMDYPFDAAEPGEIRALHRSTMRLHEVAMGIAEVTGNRDTPQKLGVAILGNHSALARSKPATMEDLLALNLHALECSTVLMDKVTKNAPLAIVSFWLLVLEGTLKNLRDGLEVVAGQRVDDWGEPTIYRDLMTTYVNPPQNGVSDVGEQ